MLLLTRLSLLCIVGDDSNASKCNKLARIRITTASNDADCFMCGLSRSLNRRRLEMVVEVRSAQSLLAHGHQKSNK